MLGVVIPIEIWAAETPGRCFLSQVPIALLLFFMGAWKLPSKISNVKEPEPPPGRTCTTASKLSDLDFLGLVTFILTMTTFLLIFSLGGRNFPWNHPVILSLVAACMALGIFFVLIQGLIAEKPLIPLRLLRSNGVGVSCLVQILLFVARWAVSMSFIALHSQNGSDPGSFLPILPLTSYASMMPAMLLLRHTLCQPAWEVPSELFWLAI